MTIRLFLLNPEIIFAARVNQSSFTYPLAEATFDGVTTGAYGDIEVGMTVLFGTSAGDDDLGRQRVREVATSTVVYFGRSSEGIRDGEVDLEDNAYITVLNDFRVWSKIPYADVSSDSPPQTTWYKDHDLVVGTNTTDPPPVANTSPGVMATIDDITSLITVYFGGDNSFTIADGAVISTYAWDVDDGTITVGTSASANITVTFPAGFRWVKLTVTDDNGETHTARCPVFARDPDSDDTIDNVEITSHRITLQGQTISVRISEEILETTYPDGTLVMIADGEPSASTDRSHMILIGWHDTDPAIIRGGRTATIQETALTFVDVAGRMQNLIAFSQEVETATVPSDWDQMTSPDHDKYVHYLLHWHSTALELADYNDTGTGANFAMIDFASLPGNLFGQVASRCLSLEPDYHFTCNTLGQLRQIIDPMLQDSVDRTSTIQASIDGDDYSDLRYTHQRSPRIAMLQHEEGIIVSASTAENLAFADAPGSSPGQGVSIQSHGNQLTPSQSVMNAVVGHRYARINALESAFRIVFSGSDDLGIEPSDLTWVRLTIDSSAATHRGLAFTIERGLPHELNIRYAHERTGLVRTVEMIWERESSGTPGVTWVPPESDWVASDDFWPGDGGDRPGSGDTVDAFDNGLYNGQEKVAIICRDGYVYRTTDFQSGSPTWDRVSLGISDYMYSWIVDPFSPGYRGTGTSVNGFIATEGYLYKVSDLFGTPSLTTLITFSTSALQANGCFRSIGASFGRYFTAETDNPWLVVVSDYNDAAGHEREYVTYSKDAGASWSSEVRITTNITTAQMLQREFDVFLSPRTPGLIYFIGFKTYSYPNHVFVGYKSEDWGATWAEMSNPYLNSGIGNFGPVHVPWLDNSNEIYVFHSSQTLNAGTHSHRIVRGDGTSGELAYLGTSDGTRYYGSKTPKFGIRTYDSDRNYVAAAGVGNGSSTATADDRYRIMVSDDGGNTWTFRTSAVSSSIAHPKQIAFAGDSPDVFFIWGSRGYIKYSEDFGVTIDDKRGNLIADFSGNTLPEFLGIAGGPPP